MARVNLKKDDVITKILINVKVHGKVYKDMEECKGFVTELADKVFDKIYNQN